MTPRENLAMKAMAFIAAVAAFTATAIMGWYQLANFDALWTDGFQESGGYTKKYLVRRDYNMVSALVELYERQAAGEELSLAGKRAIERYEAEFDAGATNLRWQLLDKDGKVIYGNTQEDSTAVDADWWMDYARKGEILEVNSGWDYWDTNKNHAINWTDDVSVRFDDNWRNLLSGLVEAAQSQENAADTGVILFVPDGDAVVVPLDEVRADDDGFTNYLCVRGVEVLYL